VFSLINVIAEEEDDVPYLVDFQQKYIDKSHQRTEADMPAGTHSADVPQATISDDDW